MKIKMSINKIIKKNIFIVLVCLLISISFASSIDQVRIIKVHYTNANNIEEAEVVDSVAKPGYYPDYNFAGDTKYYITVEDPEGNQKFSASIPPIGYAYLHSYSEKEKTISGGLMSLDEAYLSFIIPKYTDNDKIKIIDNENKTILSYVSDDANTKESSKAGYAFWTMIIFLIGLLLIIIFKILKKKLNK